MLNPERNSILTDLYAFRQISDFSIFKSFDCGDEDLNEFIQKDAERHKAELIAETYAFSFSDSSEEPVAFVSLSNDLVKLTADRKQVFPERLRYSEMPAVKIVRLGVNVLYQRASVGTEMLNIVKALFTTHNRTGCRFITVDAYNKDPVLRFYRKNDFELYYEKDQNRKTRTMFFDLKTYVDSPPRE